MTDSPKLDVPVSPSPPVPRTMVLGYFSRTSAPTRVRRFTAVVLLILAVVDTALTAGGGYLTLRSLVSRAHMVVSIYGASGSPRMMSWLDRARLLWFICRPYCSQLLLILLGVVLTILLIWGALGAYRGWRRACTLALGPVLVHILFLLLCSAAMLALVIFGLVDDGGLPSWRTVLMLALGLLSGLLALLAIDLCAFLRWIARMPDANPPPRKFV